MKIQIIQLDNFIEQDDLDFLSLHLKKEVNVVHCEKKNFLKTKDYFNWIKSQVDFEYFLFIDQVWSLYDKDLRRIKIDFDQDRQYKRAISHSDLIIRSINLRAKKIIDVSMGLAIDAVHLVRSKKDVIGFERNPLLYLLLRNAIKKNSFQDKLKVNFGSFFDYVRADFLEVDAFYFDPMFPEKSSSALPKQEMVLFRNLVGADEDASDVAKKILEMDVRLVIKRPSSAPVLIEKPKIQYQSNLIRFDVYGV